MRLPFYIARRYLFSRKKQNAINIISGISIVGVTVGTAALIIVLSVFNGIGLFLEQMTDSLTPDLVISPATGKYAPFDSTIYASLKNNPEIAYFNRIVEEKALVKYGEKLSPVIVKGVTEDFASNTHLDNNIVQGNFKLSDDNGNFKSVVGYSLAADLGIGLNFLTPMVFYYPNKESSSALSALNTEYLYPAAFFSSQQDIDGKYVLTDIRFAQQLFNIGNNISKIEIKLNNQDHTDKVKNELKSVTGDKYKTEDKYELNRSYYAMMKSEKFAVFVILLFILLIASFNIVGSISMLILDKKDDLTTYKALGMPQRKIIAIFKTEGRLITLLGAIAGLAIGTTVCLLQEKFGFITLGDGSGNYVINAYPVKLVFSDIAWIMATVIFIGYTASYFPVRYLVKRLTGK